MRGATKVGRALRGPPAQAAPGSPVSLFLLFEPHKWCLYETRQARCSEEQTVVGLRTPMGGRCWGVETPGQPDSDRDVTRGVPDLMRGVASNSQLASVSGHQREHRAKRCCRGQRERSQTLCMESLGCSPSPWSVRDEFARSTRPRGKPQGPALPAHQKRAKRDGSTHTAVHETESTKDRPSIRGAQKELRSLEHHVLLSL
jgi:hypothetical protein